jgi:hypothetical protein
MKSVMNYTKWEELRQAMYELGDLRPRWRAKDLSGYVSPWDGEWFYHFRNGSYKTMEWVEIQVSSPEQDESVLASIKAIHLPGLRIDSGYRIYGYVDDGDAADYL